MEDAVTALITRDQLRAEIDAGSVTVVDALGGEYYAKQHLPGAVPLVEAEVADRAAGDRPPPRAVETAGAGAPPGGAGPNGRKGPRGRRAAQARPRPGTPPAGPAERVEHASVAVEPVAGTAAVGSRGWHPAAATD